MDQTFPIEPAAGAAPLVILALVALALVGVTVAVGRSVLASRAATFVVTSDALALRGDWWGRRVPRASIRADEVRVADLRREHGLQPVSRRWGTGLPGYGSGWFRLRNGDRALLYLTDRSRTVVVPTDLGYTILLSPRDPDGLAEALRQ